MSSQRYSALRNLYNSLKVGAGSLPIVCCRSSSVEIFNLFFTGGPCFFCFVFGRLSFFHRWEAFIAAAKTRVLKSPLLTQKPSCFRCFFLFCTIYFCVLLILLLFIFLFHSFLLHTRKCICVRHLPLAATLVLWTTCKGKQKTLLLILLVVQRSTATAPLACVTKRNNSARGSGPSCSAQGYAQNEAQYPPPPHLPRPTVRGAFGVCFARFLCCVCVCVCVYTRSFVL